MMRLLTQLQRANDSLFNAWLKKTVTHKSDERFTKERNCYRVMAAENFVNAAIYTLIGSHKIAREQLAHGMQWLAKQEAKESK